MATGDREVTLRRVRWRLVLAAVALFAAGGVAGYVARPAPLLATVTPELAAAEDGGNVGVFDGVLDAGEWFALQVDSAWEQLRSSGRVDVVGFALPLRVASDQVATVVAVAVLDGVCYFGGVVDGGQLRVRTDPSGVACSDELFSELELALAGPPELVVVALTRAAGDALRFASLALSGRVSLSGYVAPGVVTSAVADDGSSAVLSLDGWCVTVVVPDAGAAHVVERCQ